MRRRLFALSALALGLACAAEEEQRPFPEWEDAIVTCGAWNYEGAIHRAEDGVELWARENDEPRPAVPRGVLTSAAEDFLRDQCGTLTPEEIEAKDAMGCATSDAAVYSLRLEVCDERLAVWCDELHGLEDPWQSANDFTQALVEQMRDCEEGEWFVPADDCEPLDPY